MFSKFKKKFEPYLISPPLVKWFWNISLPYFSISKEQRPLILKEGKHVTYWEKIAAEQRTKKTREGKLFHPKVNRLTMGKTGELYWLIDFGPVSVWFLFLCNTSHLNLLAVFGLWWWKHQFALREFFVVVLEKSLSQPFKPRTGKANIHPWFLEKLLALKSEHKYYKPKCCVLYSKNFWTVLHYY